MKRFHRILVFTSLAFGLIACAPLEIDFNDPQDVSTIQDEFMFDVNEALQENNDLVELFGEENIHFGPVPPSWSDSICFRVNGMDYVSCVRYIYDPYHDNAIILSQAAPPDFDASINVHLFYDKNQCVFKHEMKTRDAYANYYFLDLERAFIIGHDSLFTTYYQGKTLGNGDPTVLMLISGTMVFDTITDGDTQKVVFKGVRDYIFGKKILKYEYQPSQAFAPGTIEIKKHPGLSLKCNWNEL